MIAPILIAAALGVPSAAPSTAPSPTPTATPPPTSALPSIDRAAALPYPAYGTPQPQIILTRPAPGVPTRVTLDQATAIAIDRVPSLAAARAEVAVEEAAVQLARTGLAPNVSVSATGENVYGQNGSARASAGTVATTGAGAAVRSPDNFQENSAQVSLSQLIFDGGHIRAQIEAASLTRDATLATYRRDAQSVAYNVASAYYTVLQDERIVAVDAELLRQDIVSEDLVRARVRAGVAAGADIASQVATTANARTTLVNAQGALQNDRVTFATALGLDADIDVVPLDDTQGLETVTPANPLPAFADALNVANAERPDIAEARLTIRSSEASLRAARRGLSPTLSLAASKGLSSTSIGGGAYLNNAALGLTLSIPVYDQGVTRADVASSRANVAVATANAATTQLTVEQQVRQALITIVSNRAALDQTRAAYAAAQTSLNSTQGQYRVGVSTLPSLIQAEATLASAATNIVNAIYTLRLAQSNLRYALGTNLQ